MISAEVMRALAVSGYPVTGPCPQCGHRRDPTLESLLSWLVQRRQTDFEFTIAADGSWHAIGRWPGPDRALEADGQSAADALAKIVLDVVAREGLPHSTST